MRPTQWVKAGRGRLIDFYATDEEVQGWLNGLLLTEYGPYCVVGSDHIREGGDVKAKRLKTYIEVPFSFPVSQFDQCRNATAPPRWSFHIRAEQIQDVIQHEVDLPFTMACGLNGYVSFQHGRVYHEKREASSVGMLDRVVNLKTGEMREHREYRRVFESLRRAIRKKLTWSSVQTLPNGKESEDVHSYKMTDAVVEAWNNGLALSRKPGRRLK